MPSAKREKQKKGNPLAPGESEGTSPTVVAEKMASRADHGNDYQRLLIALRDAPAGSLLFLQLNSPVQRRQLPEQLKADGLQRSFAVADFAQLPTGPPPYGVLREFVEELDPKPEILFVDGLEHRIETQPDTILNLNLGRERLANFGVVVVFLLPAYVIDLIRAHALNLWSWRAHHYALESPDDRHGQDGAVLSFATGHIIPPGDTPEARDRRIRILQRFLTEGLAENRSVESLLRPVLIPLANDLFEAGRFTEVLTLIDRLQSVVTSGEDSSDKAAVLNLQAKTLATLGEFDRAELSFQRALAIREKILGPNHPDTGASLNNLAALYYAQGLYAQAEPLYQRALTIYEKVLTPNHPDTATSLNNLALLYYTQGRYAQAEPLVQRALAIWENALGPEHPHVATVLGNYAALLRASHREAEAGKLEERARAIQGKRERKT